MRKAKLLLIIIMCLLVCGCFSNIKSDKPVYQDRDSAKKLAIDTVNERYGKTFIFKEENMYDINRYNITVYEEGYPDNDVIIVINNNIEVIDDYLWVLNKDEANKIGERIIKKYPSVLYVNSGLSSGNNNDNYDINTPLKKYILDKGGYMSMDLYILEQESIESTASIINNIINDFHEEGLSINLFVNMVPIDEANIFKEQLKDIDVSTLSSYFEIYSRFFKIKNKDWSSYEEILSDMKERVRLEEEFQKKQKQFE